MAQTDPPSKRANKRNSGTDHNAPAKPQYTQRVIEKMGEAARLRAAGLTFREIGKKMGHDPSYCRSLVIKALREATYESADIMRTQEGIRLDTLQRAFLLDAMNPEVDIVTRSKAASVLLRIMDRRAKLFGLDAPIEVKVDVSLTKRMNLALTDLENLVIPGDIIDEQPGTPDHSPAQITRAIGDD